MGGFELVHQANNGTNAASQKNVVVDSKDASRACATALGININNTHAATAEANPYFRLANSNSNKTVIENAKHEPSRAAGTLNSDSSAPEIEDAVS